MRAILVAILMIVISLSVNAQSKDLQKSNYWLLNNIKPNIATNFDDAKIDTPQSLSVAHQKRCFYVGSIPLIRFEKRIKDSNIFMRRRHWAYTSENFDYEMYMMFNRSQFGTVMTYRAPWEWLITLQGNISARRSRRSELKFAVTHMIGEHWQFAFKLEHNSLQRRQYLFENGIKALSSPIFNMTNNGNRAFFSFSYNFGR